MIKVLVPVDGSANSLRAVRHIVNQFMENHAMEVHLLHVRTPLSQHAARFISKRDRAAYHRDEAEKALRPARVMLEKFGVPYAAHIELGDKARIIKPRGAAPACEPDRAGHGTQEFIHAHDRGFGHQQGARAGVGACRGDSGRFGLEIPSVSACRQASALRWRCSTSRPTIRMFHE